MKITGIRTYMFNVDTSQGRPDPGGGERQFSAFKTWLFLKLESDSGLCGWGEGSG